jgi:6-phosphogluconolactonase
VHLDQFTKPNNNIMKKLSFPNQYSVTACLLIISLLLGGVFFSCSKKAPETVKFYIASIPEEGDTGIYLYEYHIPTGEFQKIQEVHGQKRTSYLALHPEGRFLYAVNQVSGYDGRGEVAAFSVDANTGVLSFINRQSSIGVNPCHISVFPDGKHVGIANYLDGSVTFFPVSPDGSLETAVSFFKHEGSSVNELRQKGPHAHSIYPFMGGEMALAADLGIDKVMVYQPDGMGGWMPGSPSSFPDLEPGSGPRHMAIHPGNRWIYVVNELNSTITRYKFEKDTFTRMESISTLPPEFDGNNTCADIRVHPGGRFLYTSNRGHNSIAIFGISDEGILKPIGHETVRGEFPRNFNIDPSGRLLFVANQRTDNITVFNIDSRSGQLEFQGSQLNVVRPVCIEFLQ